MENYRSIIYMLCEFMRDLKCFAITHTSQLDVDRKYSKRRLFYRLRAFYVLSCDIQKENGTQFQFSIALSLTLF